MTWDDVYRLLAGLQAAGWKVAQFGGVSMTGQVQELRLKVRRECKHTEWRFVSVAEVECAGCGQRRPFSMASGVRSEE